MKVNRGKTGGAYFLIIVIMASLIFIAGCVMNPTSSSDNSSGVQDNNKTQITATTWEPRVIAISAGGDHAIGLLSDGTVIAWCENKKDLACKIPKKITTVRTIAAGDQYNLVLEQMGTVVFWGISDTHKQIPTLTNVSLVSNITALSSGCGHGLALNDDGTVIARGSNKVGAMDVPANLTDVVAISAGCGHSLALKKDGTVVAWGRNDKGQINVPQDLKNVIAISGGLLHSLALKKDGTVVAWGGNENGQTGVPANLTDVVAISAGYRHSLALKKDGTVVAWGQNDFNQSHVPDGLKDVQAISAGGSFSMALKKDGTVVSWGALEIP